MGLKDEDIVTTRAGRRSFLARMGVALIGSTAVALGTRSSSAADTDRGRPADSKVHDSDKKDKTDHDKREPGDPKTPARSKDTDRGRPADSKVHDSDKRDKTDHDKREPGDPK